MANNVLLKELYSKNGLESNDVYTSKQNYSIITRTGIEKIQAKNKINVTYEIVRCERDWVVVKAKAYSEIESLKGSVETLGSAVMGERISRVKKDKNGKEYTVYPLVNGNTDQWYLAEMAEKRALSRAVLKLCGFYKYGIFSEDESEEISERNGVDEKLEASLAAIKNKL